jgi:hypothetical protein
MLRLSALCFGYFAVVLASSQSSLDREIELTKLADYHGVALPFQSRIVGQMVNDLVGSNTIEHNQHFRRELGLTHEQIRALTSLTRGPVSIDDETLMDELQKLLRPLQFKRFSEVQCQLEGLYVLRHNKYRRPLDLSAAQIKSIDQQITEYSEKSRSLHASVFVARTELETPQFLKSLYRLSWELDSKILSCLSKSQRESWTNLLGEKYDFGQDPRDLVAAPDGTQFAFVGSYKGGLGTFVGLISRDGKQTKCLTDCDERNRNPRFFPDGKKLIFSTTKIALSDYCQIKADGSSLINLSVGSKERVLNEPAHVSPDGCHIVFATKWAEICYFNLATRQLTKLPQRGHRPVIFLDGRQIVYQEGRDEDSSEDHKLFVVNVDGTNAVELDARGRDVAFVQKDRFAFLCGAPGKREIWSMKTDGTEKRQLTSTGGIKACLSAHSDGTKLVFMSHTYQREPWTVCESNADGTNVKTLFEIW